MGLTLVSIKTLSLDFAFYGLLDLLQRSVSIIMVPVYTRVLSQKEYGDLDIIIIFSSVLFILVDLQFVSGFSRLYYEYRNEGKGSRFAGTAIMSRLIGGAIISAVFLLLGFLGEAEVNFLPSFSANATVWVLSVISIPLSLAYDILLLQTRMLRWKKWFAIGALSTCFLSCALSAYFAIVLNWGVASVVLGLLLGKLVGLPLLAWGLRKEVKLCLDFEPFKELIRYSLPLVPGWWLAFGSAYVSRFFVYGELGADQNAILAVCMKIASVIGLFDVSFQTAWQPLAMANIGNTSGDIFYVRSMRLYIAGGIFTIFWITAFLDPILNLLAPSSYSVAKYYFPLFAVGSLLSGCANNLQLGNQIAKTTHWISISSLVSIAFNIAVLIVFTKSLGIIAAGLAWVISFAVKDLIMYYTAQRSYHISYDKRSFLLLGLGCGLLLLLGSANYYQRLAGWLFTSCVASIGVIIPWLVTEAFERKTMKDFLRQRLVPYIFS